MTVHLFATLREIAGARSIDIDLPTGATAGDLLDCVLERFPAMREELLDDTGALSPHVHLFVNGRDAPYLDDAMATVLKDVDKIDLFPAVAGG